MRFRSRHCIVAVSCVAAVMLVVFAMANHFGSSEAPTSDAVVDNAPIYDVSREGSTRDTSSDGVAADGQAVSDGASSADSVAVSQQSGNEGSSSRSNSNEAASGANSAPDANSRLSADTQGQNSSASASDSFDGKHLDENGVYKPDDKSDGNAGSAGGNEPNKGSEEDTKWGAIT